MKWDAELIITWRRTDDDDLSWYAQPVEITANTEEDALRIINEKAVNYYLEVITEEGYKFEGANLHWIHPRAEVV